MKTLTCREMGGECDEEITAATPAEMTTKMTEHVMENHPDTAKKMEEQHNRDPKEWGTSFQKKWAETEEN